MQDDIEKAWEEHWNGMGVDAIGSPSSFEAGYRAHAARSGWVDIENSSPEPLVEIQGWFVNDQGIQFWEPKVRVNENLEVQIWDRVDYDQDGWDTYPTVTMTHWMLPPPPPQLKGGE